MISPKFVRLIFTLFLLGSLLIQPVPARAQDGPALDHTTGGEMHLIDVTLQADGAPSLGGTANLSVEVIPQIDAPDLTIQWIVPDEVTLLGSDIESFGSTASQQSVTSQRQIVFPAYGTYKIIAQGKYDLAGSSHVSAAGVLFFTISPTGSTVSDKDPNAVNSNHSRLMATKSTQALASTMSPDDKPCF
ncbi:MAG: hypothetical protein EHM70_22920 [Chloroflexota bacterium]|nr:MAG: hypothetical protein EHM70_22920 [Chloroflexota bacterium]